MSKANQNLSKQVKKLLAAVGVEIYTYDELKQKMNFGTDIIETMTNKKALHIGDNKIIAICDDSLTSTEDVNELILHELIHMTAANLNRKCQTEAGFQTEECTAQIGMFKLTLVLGLNPAPYADRTLDYIKQFPKANFRKAEIYSDKAVEYLVKFIGLEKVA